MYLHMNIYIHVCICICIYIHLHIRIYIYAHTHMLRACAQLHSCTTVNTRATWNAIIKDRHPTQQKRATHHMNELASREKTQYTTERNTDCVRNERNITTRRQGQAQHTSPTLFFSPAFPHPLLFLNYRCGLV